MADQFEIPEQIMSFLLDVQKQGIKDEAKTLASRSPYLEKGKTILLGDSITAQFPIYELAPGLSVLNRGVSGDTTQGILDRLEDTVICLKPSRVFLMAGTNDLGNGVNKRETLSNYKKIVETIKKACPTCQIYCDSILHVNKKRENPTLHSVGLRNNKAIDELNGEISKIEGVTYLNLNPLFLDQEGNLDASLTPDGLHLNIQAYIKYLTFLKPYLEK